ncbi:hypothetical protein [Treponema brennaborense]|uniref:Uncharacterized protein n=1 Tax=Treponema brennaborense (strain DSM 12168 / CIP 105900 / DD5/3) TaxID=906968 RepID=F4LKX5_TREBD|nr:hypothetical protein [Treponema brennaborense]AEE16572.1 hypothetical protein Trebr_1144 [Treponema brennaborense DSM 12168]
MVTPKLVIITAVIGFVLSFCTGLFSGVAFGIVVLRALLFAAVFAAIAYGTSVVFKKFLAGGGDVVQLASESAETSRPGSVVDITIGDEALPEEEDSPDFFVSDEMSGSVSKSRPTTDQGRSVSGQSAAPDTGVDRRETGQTGLSGGSGRVSQPRVSAGTPDTVPAGAADSAAAQFKPVRLGSTVSSDSDVSDLDVLPDIGDLVINEGGGQSAIMEDTDFAEGISGDAQSGLAAPASGGGSMDTETIAKAIRTALARDS